MCVCVYIYTMYIYTHTHTHLCMHTSIIIGEVYDVEGGRVVSSGGGGVGGGGANRQPYAYPAVPGNKNSQTKFSNIGALVYLSLCLLQTDFLADPAYLIRLESISFLFGFFGSLFFWFFWQRLLLLPCILIRKAPWMPEEQEQEQRQEEEKEGKWTRRTLSASAQEQAKQGEQEQGEQGEQEQRQE